MGRAIVRSPRVFLMDEPLSNLDAKLRVQTRAEIANLQRDLNTTTLYVTHDQTEAMTMGHRVAVLRDGVLQQVATPRELYDTPANVFVAGFIGSPSMNVLRASLTDAGARVGDLTVPLPRERLTELAGAGSADIGIRPESFELSTEPTGLRLG
jgi:multiple sugar transport system ATP-binding protein